VSAGNKHEAYRTFGVKVRVDGHLRNAPIYTHRMVAATFLTTPPFKANALIGVHHIGDRHDKNKNDPRYISWMTNVDNIMQDFYTTLQPDVDFGHSS
jgi:hypothetical protein